MKVFLDVDGVLANFLAGIHEALGVPYSYEDYPYEKAKWHMLTDIPGVDKFTDIDGLCDEDFWTDLDWIHDGQEIEQAVRDKFKDIYLLTTPMPNPGSGTGKLFWIKEHMPWMYKKTILSYAPKSLLAGPDTLLIDDKDQNIEEFRASGGQGILVPRPWNKLHGWSDKTLEIVKNCLEAY